MLVSIIIRTYNEEKYLADLLESINLQIVNNLRIEVIVVDSGSTDRTLQIATKFNCKIAHITKDEFTFGRSLNLGCRISCGEILVFISGHCIPVNKFWLDKLVSCLSKDIPYVYGGQVGTKNSRFSECRIFEKYYPESEKLIQEGFFSNNANSALYKSIWDEYKFNELITGLEDMELAKRLFYNGYRIGYVSEAKVYHIHSETWSQIKNRFEREAMALKEIMPEIQLSYFDFLKFLFLAIFLDLKNALKAKVFCRLFFDIISYRSAQFIGVYNGNHINRYTAKLKKQEYYYPR